MTLVAQYVSEAELLAMLGESVRRGEYCNVRKIYNSRLRRNFYYETKWMKYYEES